MKEGDRELWRLRALSSESPCWCPSSLHLGLACRRTPHVIGKGMRMDEESKDARTLLYVSFFRYRTL